VLLLLLPLLLLSGEVLRLLLLLLLSGEVLRPLLLLLPRPLLRRVRAGKGARSSYQVLLPVKMSASPTRYVLFCSLTDYCCLKVLL
jgi:hypothetical protein